MACIADVTPVIVGADGVRLYLGRTTRLASPAQRRALRAMYRRCAVPGCSACWDSVVIHHLKYFRHGGLTDIDNLLPLCIKHHHFAHEGGWQFRLGLDRTLTIVRPDGTTTIHAPPHALAA
jgi:predicted restriction endonuclease